MKFVVGKGILTREQVKNLNKTRVEIYNNDKIISGAFNDNYKIRYWLSTSGSLDKTGTQQLCFDSFKFSFPSYSSTVKKTEGVEWYLCFDSVGRLNIKNHVVVEQTDFLITEMGGDGDFDLHGINFCFEFFSNF